MIIKLIPTINKTYQYDVHLDIILLKEENITIVAFLPKNFNQNLTMMKYPSQSKLRTILKKIEQYSLTVFVKKKRQNTVRVISRLKANKET